MTVHSGRNLPKKIAGVIPERGFTNSRVLVVGDLMLDRYVRGEVTRISPEAPVPVLAVRGERLAAGGAANVMLNVAATGAVTIALGVVGNDSNGRNLRAILAESAIDTQSVIVDYGRPTSCKTRIVSGNHQIVRLDEECTEDLASTVADALVEKTLTLIGSGVNAVVLSDYAKGVMSDAVIAPILGSCAGKGIPVFVDPKRTDYTAYSGATCLTPNNREFRTALQGTGISARDFVAAGQMMRKKLNCPSLLVTQGAEGMTLFTGEASHYFPAFAEEVFDVSGAGDTVIATLASAVAAGLDFVSAVQLANIAAGLVVRKPGTTPLNWDELYAIACENLASDPPYDLPSVYSRLPA